MRSQFFALVRLFTAELSAARPELRVDDAELLVWAMLGVLTSHSYHDTPAGPDLLAEVLRAMALAVVTAPVASVVAPPAAAPRSGAGLLPHSSRERLLVVSIRLFAQHGYQAVSMADVGAAAGVTGTAVYRHFATKSELLAAGLGRSVDPMRLCVADALESASTAAEALANVVGAHVDFALRQHELLGLLASETVNLQGPQQREIHLAQQEYVQEWVHLVRQSDERLTAARARFLVHGALTLISDLTRTASLRNRPDLAVQLRVLALRVLSA
jgi:AcrR family transcriptional regulator